MSFPADAHSAHSVQQLGQSEPPFAHPGSPLDGEGRQTLAGLVGLGIGEGPIDLPESAGWVSGMCGGCPLGSTGFRT